MIDCNNFSIKVQTISLMVPAATVSLKMSSWRTKAIPARTNGINSKM